ncbi:MAG: type II toxin-antitoxin system Phd/YefM family antitoxin [Actinobacteria bacterium]|nr:type II toxin-antitoxin system Phd/YefM family antitoxin [Actinomycetota bacterium]
MEKTVPAFDARRQFGKILQEVAARGDRYVVERHGEPVAVVVPLEVYEQWKRSRAAFFDRIRSASNRANMPAEEAASLADEAVQAARASEK